MPAQPPPIPPAQAQSFDLSRLSVADGGVDLHVRQHCAPAEAGEIVVCVRTRERNRLEALPDRAPQHNGLPKAKLDLGGGKSLGVTTESSAMGGGATSKRVMVTGTIRF